MFCLGIWQVAWNHHPKSSTYSSTARTDLSRACAMKCLVAIFNRSPKIVISSHQIIHQLLEQIYLEHMLWNVWWQYFKGHLKLSPKIIALFINCWNRSICSTCYEMFGGNIWQVTSNCRLMSLTYSSTARTDLSGACALKCLVEIFGRSPQIITSSHRLIHRLLEQIYLEHVLWYVWWQYLTGHLKSSPQVIELFINC
jgi:hypothetical protein